MNSVPARYGGLQDLRSLLIELHPDGDIPSLVTLKRWSARGRFDGCREERGVNGGRGRLNLTLAAELVKPTHPNVDVPDDVHTKPSAPSQFQTDLLLDLRNQVSGLADAMSGMSARMDRLSGAVENLEAVRRSLMLKYDESHTRLQALVNSQGRASSVAHPGQDGGDLVMARIAKRLQNIEELLARSLEDR